MQKLSVVGDTQVEMMIVQVNDDALATRNIYIGEWNNIARLVFPWVMPFFQLISFFPCFNDMTFPYGA